jgi:hypothetical protein
VLVLDVNENKSKYISVFRHHNGESSRNTQTGDLLYENMPTLKYLRTWLASKIASIKKLREY